MLFTAFFFVFSVIFIYTLLQTLRVYNRDNKTLEAITMGKLSTHLLEKARTYEQSTRISVPAYDTLFAVTQAYFRMHLGEQAASLLVVGAGGATNFLHGDQQTLNGRSLGLIQLRKCSKSLNIKPNNSVLKVVFSYYKERLSICHKRHRNSMRQAVSSFFILLKIDRRNAIYCKTFTSN